MQAGWQTAIDKVTAIIISLFLTCPVYWSHVNIKVRLLNRCLNDQNAHHAHWLLCSKFTFYANSSTVDV